MTPSNHFRMISSRWAKENDFVNVDLLSRMRIYAMNYAELQSAVKLFGLGERASLKEIKSRHRMLVKRHHPDTDGTGDDEMIRKINAAYRMLSDYVASYRFSFAEDEFYEQNPEERLWHQFMDTPMWGKK